MQLPGASSGLWPSDPLVTQLTAQVCLLCSMASGLLLVQALLTSNLDQAVPAIFQHSHQSDLTNLTVMPQVGQFLQ